MTPVREHERPSMRCFPILLVEASQLLDGTAACGNAVERSEWVGREDDLAVSSPRCTSAERGVRQRLRRAAIKIEAFHLAPAKEADRLAIRRPEGERRPFRSFDSPRPH